MIFLTVGTQFEFDRLVRAVDSWLITRPGVEVFGQIGPASYWPKRIMAVKWLNRAEYTERLQASEGIISHAGIGTILQCLEVNKPLLVLPRRASLGECINDHQITTARKFEKLGLLQVAYDKDDVPGKLDRFCGVTPMVHVGKRRAAMIDRITKYLDSIQSTRRRGP